MKKNLFVFSSIVLVILLNIEKTIGQDTIDNWSMTGNSNATINSRFGTTNKIDLRLITNSIERMRINANGDVYVGKSLYALDKSILRGDVNMHRKLTVTGNSTFTSMVSIGADVPHSSSILDVSSSTKGVLLPRMTSQQRDSIVSPATGLLIYQTDNTPGFYYYNETWRLIEQPTATANVPNLSLSNLSPTSVNESLVPNVSGNLDLGTWENKWRNLYLSNSINSDSVKTQFLTASSIQVAGNGIFVNGAQKGLEVTGTYGVYANGLFMGVYGSSNNYYGLYGTSTSGTGVYGTSDSYYGVAGYSYSNTGINGYSYHNTGGDFVSTNSYGIKAASQFGAYAGLFEGKVLAHGYYSISDKNLKKNIKEVNDALSIINRLKPRYYDFKRDEKYQDLHLPKGAHYGLLAQELEKVLPELVQESSYEIKKLKPQLKELAITNAANHTTEVKEEVQLKAINYTELIPIILKGIQELNEAKDKQIENLQQQINELKDLVKNLSASKTANLNITKSIGYINQIIPNPTKSNATIKYYVPVNAGKASIVITSPNGSLLKTFSVSTGEGQLYVGSKELPAGTYQLSLFVNGVKVDIKQMIVVR